MISKIQKKAFTMQYEKTTWLKMGNGNHYEILPCHLVRRLQSKRQIIASVGEDVGN